MYIFIYNTYNTGWAASFGEINALIELIKLGADPLLPPNKAGNTPLTDAQRERHQHVVHFLQEYEKIVGPHGRKNPFLS